MRKVTAGIDIGGTKIAVALAEKNGAMIFRERFPTQTARGAAKILAETIERLTDSAKSLEAEIAAVGVGCASPLDLERGLVMSPPNLPGWDEFPIVDILRNKFQVPVVLDNDANAAAIGEHFYGAGRGFENLVYITISTGIGGGVIVDNKLVHGVGDGAGEIGHLCVEPSGFECNCGARGCLEAICSGTAIARRARMAILGGGKQSSIMAKVKLQKSLQP